MNRFEYLTLAAVLTVAACGDGQSPTAPTTSSPSPRPSPNPTYDWIVTHRFESVTGPDNCWVQEQRQRLTGITFPNLEMSVTRSGNSIRIQSPWFQDYVGSMTGNDFSASGVRPLEGGGRPCADGSLFTQLPGVSNLSGRFSADDQGLSATEVNSYHLMTGEPVTYRWDWQAQRR